LGTPGNALDGQSQSSAAVTYGPEQGDRERLDLHFTSVRELETNSAELSGPALEEVPSNRSKPRTLRRRTATQALNTIAAACGVKKADGRPVDDFGDPDATGLIHALIA
jgi:hypothetical protein